MSQNTPAPAPYSANSGQQDANRLQANAMVAGGPGNIAAQFGAFIPPAQAPQGPNLTEAGQQQWQNNHMNTSGPNASQTYTQNPDGTWTTQVGYGGPLGAANTNLQQQAAAAFGGALDFSGLPGLEDGAEARQAAIDASYSQATSRLDPQWQQREDAQRARLIAQGLDPSSEAYGNAESNLGRERNDAYTSAMNAAVLQGDEAQAQAFRQSYMARQQAMAELLRQRGQPLEELLAMQGLLQQPGYAQDNSSLAAAIAQGNFDLSAWSREQEMNADAVGGFLDFLKATTGGF